MEVLGSSLERSCSKDFCSQAHGRFGAFSYILPGWKEGWSSGEQKKDNVLVESEVLVLAVTGGSLFLFLRLQGEFPLFALLHCFFL